MIRFGEEPIQASLKGKRLDEFVSTRLMHETGSTKYDREMAINCLVPLDHPTQYPVNRKIWTQQSTKECTQICGILKIGIIGICAMSHQKPADVPLSVEIATRLRLS